MSTNIERNFDMTNIVLLSENTTEVTVEEKEAKLTGAIVKHLVEFVLAQKTKSDKELAISVIKKAFMHENTSWDNLGHRKWGIPETGRSGQIKFFEKYLEANGIKL